MRPTRAVAVLGPITSAAVLLLGWWGTGCATYPPFSGGEPGTLRILITDQPFPYEFVQAATITLTRVEVRRADSPADDPAEEDADVDQAEPEAAEGAEEPDVESGPFIVVFDEPEGVEFDLLSLRNGKFDLLALAEVPDPRDDTVRFVLDEPIVTDRLMLAGAVKSGTHLYSVSEIQAFGPGGNEPPVADAGGPYDAAATGWDGAWVTLDAGRSYDPDGDLLLYAWSAGGKELGQGVLLSRCFPIGQTDVSLTVTDPDGASATASATVRVSAIEVLVDIKPGDSENSINLKSHGAVPVAFLTDDGFDASWIDPATVTLAGCEFAGYVKTTGKGKKLLASLEDVDGDGDADLVVHLETDRLPLSGTETSCTFGALTRSGLLVRGTDHVRFVP